MSHPEDVGRVLPLHDSQIVADCCLFPNGGWKHRRDQLPDPILRNPVAVCRRLDVRYMKAPSA